jgi:hypothetical protein
MWSSLAHWKAGAERFAERFGYRADVIAFNPATSVDLASISEAGLRLITADAVRPGMAWFGPVRDGLASQIEV